MKYRIKLTQLAALVLLVICRPASIRLYITGMALALLGEAFRTWASGNLAKDKALAVSGPYIMVRNPLYFGSFLIGAGFCVAEINLQRPISTAILWTAVLASFIMVYRATILAEEAHLERLFGEEYQRYKQVVPSWLPDFKAFPEALRKNSFTWALFRKNREYLTITGLFLAGVFIGLRPYIKFQ